MGGAILLPVGLGLQPTIVPKRAPFDRVSGERIEGLGDTFRIVPVAKWADTPIWAEACRGARTRFRKALSPTGRIPEFDEDTVLVQEYPESDRICFIFAMWCRPYFKRYFGWQYWVFPVRLTAPLKAHLVLTGRWKTQETRH